MGHMPSWQQEEALSSQLSGKHLSSYEAPVGLVAGRANVAPNSLTRPDQLAIIIFMYEVIAIDEFMNINISQNPLSHYLNIGDSVDEEKLCVGHGSGWLAMVWNGIWEWTVWLKWVALSLPSKIFAFSF